MSERVDLDAVGKALDECVGKSFPHHEMRMLNWCSQMRDEIEALRSIVSDVDAELSFETPHGDVHWVQIKERISDYVKRYGAQGGNDGKANNTITEPKGSRPDALQAFGVKAHIR